MQHNYHFRIVVNNQNQNRNDLRKNLSYINRKKLPKGIFPLIREKAKNQFKNTMRYIFVG